MISEYKDRAVEFIQSRATRKERKTFKTMKRIKRFMGQQADQYLPKRRIERERG